ncbi:MAG: hypothetical protein GY797_29280, partial [Deltaproteobacteria bacterium]|nr:hypothetical protein [Deltaproteobacteria bacterium]
MIPSEKLLQLPILPLEYPKLIEKRDDALIVSKEYFEQVLANYYEQLPAYQIARCPLCGDSYAGKIDPHSLRYWDTVNFSPGRYFYAGHLPEKYEYGVCEHRVAVQRFVNLHGLFPQEFSGVRNDLHVPFVIPFFVPNDILSYAVIHSFAICRLEDEMGRIYNYKEHTFENPMTKAERSASGAWLRDRKDITERSAEDTAALEKAMFVPRYTAYAVTYYSEEPQELVRRRVDSEREYGADDPEYEPLFLASMGEMTRQPHAYDLPYWVEQGKLQWLDLESPDLSLKAGPVEDFPYVNIQDDSGGFKA